MGDKVTSNRALARRLKVSESAVRQAEADGRIAREPDGSWNLDAVRRAWRENTEPGHQRARQQKRGRAPAAATGGRRLAVGDVAAVEARVRNAVVAAVGPGAIEPGPLTFAAIRRLDALLKAEKRALEVARIRGDHLDRTTTLRLVTDHDRVLRTAVESMPAEECDAVAAALGVDPRQVLIALSEVARRLCAKIAREILALPDSAA